MNARLFDNEPEEMNRSIGPLYSGPEPLPKDHRAGKYLSFRLAKDEFAIQVRQVREIMGLQPITVVAQTPAYMKGIMNLRSRPIPVVHLGLKLGLPESLRTPRTSIVVVQMHAAGENTQIGLIVDSMSEVLSLKVGEIETSMPVSMDSLRPYLLGVVKVKGRPRFLLDMDQVLTAAEVQALEPEVA